MTEPLIFERSSPSRTGYNLPQSKTPHHALPEDLLRSDLQLPEVSELDVVRHFVRLSQLNMAIDTNFYPLGSCTMKYNPKVNEVAASHAGVRRVHPYTPSDLVQGALEIMWHLQQALAEIAGLPAVSLQPAAGAHGELTGMLIVRAYHRSRHETDRDTVLIPDSAHGTNPATAAMAGYKVVTLPSDDRGNVDVSALRSLVGSNTAAIMLTNPNTLGLFDEHLEEVCRLVHEAGGLVYGDGANMDAILGIVRPGDVGFDILHFNLHKTFSTPHGGGGPGAGPVAVRDILADFLPEPIVERQAGEDGSIYLFCRPGHSIGRIRSFWGSYAVLVRALTYILQHGSEGIPSVSEHAVLNANYLLTRMRGTFTIRYDRSCMHEFVMSGSSFKRDGVRTLDIAKRLIDYGFHPPTIYFPLIVGEALMVEPTETESKEVLDQFAEAMRLIAEEARREPEVLRSAPHHTPVGRLDEAAAARRPDVNYYRRAQLTTRSY